MSKPVILVKGESTWFPSWATGKTTIFVKNLSNNDDGKAEVVKAEQSGVEPGGRRITVLIAPERTREVNIEAIVLEYPFIYVTNAGYQDLEVWTA